MWLSPVVLAFIFYSFLSKIFSSPRGERLSFKYTYKVVHNDKESILLEEISKDKNRHFLKQQNIDQSSYAIRPGDNVNVSLNEKQDKLIFTLAR